MRKAILTTIVSIGISNCTLFAQTYETYKYNSASVPERTGYIKVVDDKPKFSPYQNTVNPELYDKVITAKQQLYDRNFSIIKDRVSDTHAEINELKQINPQAGKSLSDEFTNYLMGEKAYSLDYSDNNIFEAMKHNINLYKNAAKDAIRKSYVSSYKNELETYRQTAEKYKSMKNYAEAAEYYGKIIMEDPNTYPTDYFWWGIMYYYSKNYIKAEYSFKQMLSKYPDHPSASYWSGRVAAAQDNEGKTCEGTIHYKKWLRMVGDFHDVKGDLMQAYQYLALCAYNQDNKIELKTYMGKIETLEPNNSFLKQLKELTK